MKKVLQNFAAYGALMLVLALGMWLFFLGREALTGLMRTYFVGNSFIRGYQAGLFDRFLTLALGLGWLVLFVVAEELLRRSARKGGMKTVFARFLGVELVLIFILDGIMVIFLTGIGSAGLARLALLAVEMVLGAGFVYLGWSKRSPWYVKRTPPGVLGIRP